MNTQKKNANKGIGGQRSRDVYWYSIDLAVVNVFFNKLKKTWLLVMKVCRWFKLTPKGLQVIRSWSLVWTWRFDTVWINLINVAGWPAAWKGSFLPVASPIPPFVASSPSEAWRDSEQLTIISEHIGTFLVASRSLQALFSLTGSVCRKWLAL